MMVIYPKSPDRNKRWRGGMIFVHDGEALDWLLLCGVETAQQQEPRTAGESNDLELCRRL